MKRLYQCISTICKNVHGAYSYLSCLKVKMYLTVEEGEEGGEDRVEKPAQLPVQLKF